MPQLLTTASTLMCPHGGQLQAASGNSRAKAGGAALLRGSDSFTISGCPFATPGGAHPCLSVQWLKTNLRSKAGGDFLLATDSVGLCLAGDQAPQGTVIVAQTQPRAAGI